jgi:hypothetical protein
VDEEPLLLRFPSSEETNRFHRTLADSSWRRCEDTTRLRTLHKRVAAALSDTEALLAAVNNAAVAAAGGGGTINIISSPSPRSPFTLASLPPRGNSNHTARTASTSSSSGCFNLASAVAAAASDLDPDWRNHATTPKYASLFRRESSLIGLISYNKNNGSFLCRLCRHLRNA